MARRQLGANPVFLAIDAGIGGGRCVLYTPEGQIVGIGYREWETERDERDPGALVFDTDSYWRSICESIRIAISQLPPTYSVAGISVTCQREGGVFLDDQDQVLYAGPSSDQRGARINAELGKAHGEEFFRTVGLVPDSIHMPGRLLWFRENEPAIFDQIDKVLMINDWIAFRLCGEWLSEPSNACTTGLLDIKKSTWSKNILDLVGLPDTIFAPIVPSGTVAGTLLPDVAEMLGLKPSVPVVVGGGDAQCGMAGASALHEGAVIAIAGTTTPILLNTRSPQLSTDRSLWVRAHLQANRWALEANAGLTGLAVRWLRDLLFETPDGTSFATMTHLANQVPPGARGVRAHLGSRPMNVKRSGGGYIMGVGPLEGSRAEIVRATMESVCFAVRANYYLLEDCGGSQLSNLMVCGGQSQSGIWMQMQADVLQRPVSTVSVTEASAWGAAMLVGVALGFWDSLDEAASSSAGATVFEPNPLLADVYDSAFEDWLITLQHGAVHA